jgi:Fe2+ or Zn2+ uptake regulation protein
MSREIWQQAGLLGLKLFLRSQGMYATTARIKTAEVVLATEKALTPVEIHKKVNDGLNIDVSMDSVYEALRLLEDYGLVEPTQYTRVRRFRLRADIGAEMRGCV